MHRKYQNRQCLICHKELNQETSLFHLLYPRSLCLDCLSKFEVVSQKTHLLGYSTYVLYKYNDFFRKTLYQYKALDDYALKDVFLGNFPELKKVYKNDTIVIIPSSQKDNVRRGFCPNEEIVKTISKNIFTGLYKNKEYKQTKQKDRSQVHKFLSIHHGSLLTNKNILIFDDVMTSSHTLQAAIKLVEKYHPKRIRVLVLACPHIKNFIN